MNLLQLQEETNILGITQGWKGRKLIREFELGEWSVYR